LVYVFTEDDIDAARTLLANPDVTVADAADRIGFSPATLYRYLPASNQPSPRIGVNKISGLRGAEISCIKVALQLN
jgi:predicted DNA-binding transcriptional regulator YafY